jgi:hypothetical protein
MTGPLMKATLALVPFAALALTACGSPKREECRALTTIINAGADHVDKAQVTPLDPTGLKALAAGLEKAATDADALKVTQADLQKHTKDYASLVRDVAKTARDMAAAGEGANLEKAKAANTEMEKLVGNEPKVIAEVNKVCSAQ